MDALPHHYTVAAQGNHSTSHITVSADKLVDITTDAPAEFGGPGDQWSPEALLMAAVADCFILSFRAIARASHVEWLTISCQATGTLDRVERQNKFTEVALTANITAAEGGNEAKLQRLLEKAEESCLITNSMTANVSLTTSIQIG